jgi:RNA polymerase sigma-70 factor (ECF subfamily)
MAEPSTEAARWLAAARAGSAAALGQVLETCRQYLLLIAGRELDPDLRAKGGASDLVQETFLEAHRDFARFHGNSEAELRAWLRQLLLHHLGKFTRRYRGTHKRQVGCEVRLEPDGSSDTRVLQISADILSPSGEAMAHEQTEAVQQALERLPEDYRRVIALRYQEELSFEEIGKLMNRSPNAARMLWSRAVERLRQECERTHESL